jgi:cell wall-associated NlpC family hydrolase
LLSDCIKLPKCLAATGLMAGALLFTAAPAMAQTGGATPPPDPGAPPTSGVPGRATLAADGSAIPPSDAPRAVRKAINAANRIRTLPYKWGGGHGKWKDTGYDCSGAVSYVLHAAGLLKKSAMDSGTLARRWGTLGTGQWITVYGSKSHAYAVIAGLRWDTSAVGEPVNNGSGPRWRSTQRSPTGYTAKFYPGL